MPTRNTLRLPASLTLAIAIAALASCAPSKTTSPAPTTTPAPGTLDYDKSIFHDLLEGHAAIRRTVREIDNGIEATTESDDPAIAAKLADHASAMKLRMETGMRVRQWDPLFIAMFDHRESIHLDIDKTPKGIRVRENLERPPRRRPHPRPRRRRQRIRSKWRRRSLSGTPCPGCGRGQVEALIQ